MEENLYEQLVEAATVLFQEQSCKQEIHKLKEEKEIMVDLEKEKFEHEKKKVVRKTYKGLLIPGIIVTAFSGFYNLMFILMAATEGGGSGTWGVPIAMMSILLIAGVTLTILGSKKLRKQRETEALFNATKPEFDKAAEQVAKEHDIIIASVENEAKSLVPEKVSATAFLPYAYRDLYSVSYLLMLIANQRCDTLKEAINMLELERRHQQLLDAVTRISINLEQVNSALNIIQGELRKLNKNVNRIRSLETVEFLESY